MSLAAIKEIKLGDEIFDSAEEKAEVESAKRRWLIPLSQVTPSSETHCGRHLSQRDKP
jgi:hypothetical protein